MNKKTIQKTIQRIKTLRKHAARRMRKRGQPVDLNGRCFLVDVAEIQREIGYAFVPVDDVRRAFGTTDENELRKISRRHGMKNPMRGFRVDWYCLAVTKKFYAFIRKTLDTNFPE